MRKRGVECTVVPNILEEYSFASKAVCSCYVNSVTTTAVVHNYYYNQCYHNNKQQPRRRRRQQQQQQLLLLLLILPVLVSHAGTGVPECFKDDNASQWKSRKLDATRSETPEPIVTEICKGD